MEGLVTLDASDLAYENNMITLGKKRAAGWNVDDAGREIKRSWDESRQYVIQEYESQRHLHHANVDKATGFEKGRDEANMACAPLFSLAALDSTVNESEVPEFSLIGFEDLSLLRSTGINNSSIFLNTNFPASIFLCGLQGTGKSHTLSCILGIYSLLITSQYLRLTFVQNHL